MKAKYFKKIRSQVKWYKVSYRDNLFFSFSDEKEILAKSPENACVRYHKRTGCFVNKYNPNNITQGINEQMDTIIKYSVIHL